MTDQKPDLPPNQLVGTGISPGISVGTAYKIGSRTPSFYRVSILASEVSRELQRLATALETTRRQLQQIKERFEAQLGREHSYMIEAQLLILQDRPFLEEIRRRIETELESPERAVRSAAEGWLEVYRSLEDSYFQERGSDFEDVVERIVTNLAELDQQDSSRLPENLILVASEIGLSVLANYPLARIRGLVLERAGQTSHVTIIARSCRIPVVCGIENVDESIRTGETLVVDGGLGVVYRAPSPEQVAAARFNMQECRSAQPAAFGDDRPCLTLDGRRIELLANTEVESEVAAALQLGAEGIGLFRSEFIYMKMQKGAVGEEEQFQVYRGLAEAMEGRPAMIRTLDIAEEQLDAHGARAGDEGGVLGIRGIRLSLKYPEVFQTQVRAILRASRFGPLSIVLPMVSSVDEVIQARVLVAEVRQSLQKAGQTVGDVPMGVMLEVPAAVLMLDGIVRHADFLSVGTNDLIQYTLAAGRRDDQIAHLYNPLHPAILRSLQRVVEVAREKDVKTYVCGEMASHPVHASLLVGLGFDHLSMNPFAIQEVKRNLCSLDYSQLREAVDQILLLETLAEVDEFVKTRLGAGTAVPAGEAGPG